MNRIPFASETFRSCVLDNPSLCTKRSVKRIQQLENAKYSSAMARDPSLGRSILSWS